MLCGGGDVPIDTLDDLLGISLNGVNAGGDASTTLSLAKIASISLSGEGPHPVDMETFVTFDSAIPGATSSCSSFSASNFSLSNVVEGSSGL